MWRLPRRKRVGKEASGLRLLADLGSSTGAGDTVGAGVSPVFLHGLGMAILGQNNEGC